MFDEDRMEKLEDVSITDFLHQRNILVKIDTRAVGNNRKDNDGSEVVAETMESDSTMGSYVKHLFNPKGLRKINNIRNEISTSMARVGIPWRDGWHLINVSSFEDFRTMCVAIRKHWDAAVNDWLENYDKHVEEAKERLGKMFDPNQYPPKDEIANLFEFTPHYNPVPHNEDLDRLVLTSADIKEIESISNSVNEEVSRLARNGMVFVWNRVHNMLERVVNRIDENTRLNKNNTMLSTLQEVIKKMPQFNLTQDDGMSRIYKELEDSLLMTTDIMDLQGDKVLQAKIKDEAKQFMEKVSEELEKLGE